MEKYFHRVFVGFHISILLVTISTSFRSAFAQDKTVILPCHDNDTLSKQVCSCTNGVVSCDFTKFPPVQSNRETIVEIDGSNIDVSMKRVCLCDSPKTVRLSLENRFLPPSNRIHRIDLYNINGILDVKKAFQTRFGGEFFAENVGNWTRIRRSEFARGIEFDLENTQKLACCSKILPPEKLESPTLYLKNVTVTFIEHRGIDDMHAWKNVIFDKLKITNGTAESAIHFGISGLNISVSILNSEFRDLKRKAIYLKDAANVVLARSIFHHSCEQLSFVAQSSLDFSSLALIHNTFNNTMVFNLDARNIVNWFNYYDFWYPTTFVEFGKTRQKERTFSFEHNTVGNFLLKESDTIKTSPGDSIFFNENIFSDCDCSKDFPIIFQQYTNRCRNPILGSKENQFCALDLLKVKETCASNPEGNFQDMCKGKKAADASESVSSWSKVQFKAQPLSLMSPFISQQLKNIDVPIHNHELLRSRNGVEAVTEKAFLFHLLPLSIHLFFIYLYR